MINVTLKISKVGWVILIPFQNALFESGFSTFSKLFCASARIKTNFFAHICSFPKLFGMTTAFVFAAKLSSGKRGWKVNDTFDPHF